MNDKGFVETEIKDNIGIITFYHPKSNSLPGEILRYLANQIELAGKNPDIHVIILKSQGDKAFCAGASFDELVEIKDFESGKRWYGRNNQYQQPK